MTALDTAAPPVPLATRDATEPATQWGALVIVLSAIFMSTLDFFIVNVAIPSTEADLHRPRPRSSGSWPASHWR